MQISQNMFLELVIYAGYVSFLGISTDSGLVLISSHLRVFRGDCIEEFLRNCELIKW